MKLWRKVSRADVFRLTFEEHQLIQESRLRNKNWTEGKIRWTKQLEKSVYRALLYPKKDSGNYVQRITSILLLELDFTIEAKAQAYKRKWLRSTGLNADDFASVFREEVFRFIGGGGDWPNGDFYIIETLELAWKRRAVDLIRKETTKQRKWERGMEQIDASGKEHPDQCTNVEREAIIRAMLEDPSFTAEERQLFIAVYEDPEASNGELAKVLGYSHPETVRRIKKRIRDKLAR
ncbi:MAG: hypothetical protein ACQEXQ_07630 [Bacillota bacterium]